MPRILALDFDGVLCDALEEHILVAWNGYMGLDLSSFGDQGLAGVPPRFAARFERCRRFARHLGHFVVPFFESAGSIGSQSEFDAAYAGIPPLVVEDFVARVTAYRRRARSERAEAWLRRHTLYPGIGPLLRDLAVRGYIVTAKDAASVAAILGHHGVDFDPGRIFGEQRRKVEALRAIARREAVDASDIWLVDDNVFNVVEAKQAGFGARWATWGHGAPEHERVADAHSVVRIELPDLIAVSRVDVTDPATS